MKSTVMETDLTWYRKRLAAYILCCLFLIFIQKTTRNHQEHGDTYKALEKAECLILKCKNKTMDHMDSAKLVYISESIKLGVFSVYIGKTNSVPLVGCKN